MMPDIAHSQSEPPIFGSCRHPLQLVFGLHEDVVVFIDVYDEAKTCAGSVGCPHRTTPPRKSGYGEWFPVLSLGSVAALVVDTPLEEDPDQQVTPKLTGSGGVGGVCRHIFIDAIGRVSQAPVHVNL